MKCERCVKGAEATYRVYNDAMEMKVCAACAAAARRLGIAVELLDLGGKKRVGVKDGDFSRTLEQPW